MNTTGPQPSVAAATEGAKPVRHFAANGPERSEGAQGKLREPGEGSGPLPSKERLGEYQDKSHSGGGGGGT
jgi:hypothetical protein